METKLRGDLTLESYDSEKFVNKIAVEGDDSLLEGKQTLLRIGDETKRALKKNVYDNYLKFIDAAKEISILEGEMYQLNHMLTEQKLMLTTIMENSIASDRIEIGRTDDEEDSRKNLAFLMEKVEGCSHILEVAGRYLVHDGDVVELEAESFTQIQKCHMFLLNDSLMLATWQANPSKRGPVKYKYQALYELDNLAVVNVRDVGPVKNAFKVLMFPDTRMYQAENPKAKRQWLEYLEEVKKKKAAKDKARREAAAAVEKRQVPDLNTPDLQISLNPFELNQAEAELRAIDGLKEVPEDLDVLIAQRDFEGAVDLIDDVNNRLKESMIKSPILREYRSRVDQRVKQLTDILMQELQAPPERTMRYGKKSVRTAVMQLIRLGRSAQACQLFLKNRSTVIHYTMRQIKIEGATTLYVRRLSEVFFGTLHDACKEFSRAFSEKFHGCFSGIIVWAKKELEQFMDVYKRQVFGSKAGLSAVADCVYIARTACVKLQDVGLDMEFIFNSLIHDDVKKSVEDHIQYFIGACKTRAAEDKWQPSQYQSRSKLNKFLDRMINAGFTDIESHVHVAEGIFISLTSNMLTFCQLGMTFLEDLLKLNQPSVQHLVDAGISQMWNTQLKHIEESLTSVQYIKENRFILKNASWLEERVLPVAEARYLDSVGYTSTEMRHVHRAFGRIKSLAIYQAELV